MQQAFHLVVLDEAAQLKEHEGMPAPSFLLQSGRLLLCGDARQLPSKYERGTGHRSPLGNLVDGGKTLQLDMQFRMYPSYGALHSGLFYGGTVGNGDFDLSIVEPWQFAWITYVDVPRFRASSEVNGNECEAMLAAV